MTTIHVVASVSRLDPLARASVDLAVALSTIGEVVLFAEPTASPLPCPVPLRPVSGAAVAEVAACDRLITVLDNAAGHAGALRIARSTRSIVVLHDLVLDRLFLSSLPRSELEPLMVRLFGREAAESAFSRLNTSLSVWAGEERSRMGLYEAAIERAAGVVVHDPTLVDRVRQGTIVPVAEMPRAGEVPASVLAERYFAFFGAVDAAGPLLDLAGAVASTTRIWGLPPGSSLPARWAGSMLDMLGGVASEELPR